MVRSWKTVLLFIGAVALIAGCNVSYFVGEYDSDDDHDEYDLDEDWQIVVYEPIAESVYHPGDTITIEWFLDEVYDEVNLDLYRYDREMLALATEVANDGSYEWQIPVDIDLDTEIHDEYTVVISAAGDDAKDTPQLSAASELFAIVPESTGGLSDVTVDSRNVVITLTDNGAQIDGDTVTVVLNEGVLAVEHVLVEEPGSDFALTLQPGPNVLEIVAVNEGTVSPNTAQLRISNVIDGEEVQQWRLLTDETGRLTITAP